MKDLNHKILEGNIGGKLLGIDLGGKILDLTPKHRQQKPK